MLDAVDVEPARLMGVARDDEPEIASGQLGEEAAAGPGRDVAAPA